MSQDVQLGWPCPHITMEEPVTLGTDRRSLETLQPIAASSTVRVLVNNSLYVPPSGLNTPARLTGASSGPFHIKTGEDTLTVSGSSEIATVTLPTGFRVKTEDVVKKLIPVLSDVSPENVNGHLVLTDGAALGTEAKVKVTGTAAGALGFGSQYVARGKNLFPPWRLSSRDDSILNRFPMFVKSVKSNPQFKVTYSVVPERCLRCGGSYVENDWRFDLNGDVVFIEDGNLLQQAALKILLTRKGSNLYHSWYGSTLMSRIGSKAIGAVASLIQEDVQTALSKMQEQQSQQSQYQRVNPRERLYRVASVQVQSHDDDPTTFLVDVVVYNASNQPVSISVVFTVPGAVALMGSNGRSLGLG